MTKKDTLSAFAQSENITATDLWADTKYWSTEMKIAKAEDHSAIVEA